MRLLKPWGACALVFALAGAAAAQTAESGIHPETWPRADIPALPDVEARVDALLARMTLEEKVGQILQPDIGSVTPADVREYHLGSVLNGGGSAPDGHMQAPASEWLALADAFWEASTDTSDGGAGIPVIWGTDAVHGHNKAFGATLYPHNIGLGAANDPELMRRIGAATAREVRVTGHDWTFAPTLAVPQDDRWGRTYEGFSEDPAIVAVLAGPYVEGLQGAPGGDEFLNDHHVIATAKHFLGDGGTEGGRDQGETVGDEATLRDVHGAGYVPALEAGAQTVMASYSSWRGRKMHGFADLLTGVLKERMGFDGFVVGDWNGHGQVYGCSAQSCPEAFNAGIDMFMVPNDWKALYENTLAQVQSGEISEARLDDAVRRILRVKARSGVLDAPRPSERRHAGDERVLGADAYREIAREAVRKSLVLLKNADGVLPLATDQRILVTGPGADSLPMQNGGWSLTWQGAENTNADFPGATSIYQGVRQAVEAAGGEAALSADGAYAQRPDAAIVVFGETPYAEGVGDRETVAYSPGDDSDLELLQRLKADGIPVVAVFLSGRPLWVNRHLNASDAFVAAWLPGTEGAGVADVLIAAADGTARHDFTGRLSFSWPRDAGQTSLNAGQADYDPLFPLGFGLTYADDGALALLSEEPGVDLEPANSHSIYFTGGETVRPWRLRMEPPSFGMAQPAEDGARTLVWTGDGEATATISAFQPIDLAFETNADMSLVADLTASAAPEGTVTLSLGGPGGAATFEIGPLLAGAVDGGAVRIPLSCFQDAGAPIDAVSAPFAITASEPLRIELRDVRVGEGAAADSCPPAAD